MSRRIIYKYELRPFSVNEIKVPVSSNILRVESRYNSIFVWIDQPMNPLSEDMTVVEFQIIPTGSEFDDDKLLFINTVFMDPGLVFHVYCKLNKESK